MLLHVESEQKNVLSELLKTLCLIFSHPQSLVLGSLHLFTFTGSLVIYTAQVQDAMNDDAVKLALILLAELFGIGTHGIEADKEVTTDDIALGIVKGDDVGVIVVLQVLAVHFQYPLVITEDVGHLAHPFAILGRYGLDPRIVLAFFDCRETYSLGLIGYHYFNYKL